MGAAVVLSVSARAQLTADATAPAVRGARDGSSLLAPRRDLLAQVLGAGVPGAAVPGAMTGGRMKVDLGPVVDHITAYLNEHGIPLHHDPELSGENGIVFSAAFRVNESLPHLQFHVGDRGPLNAFYSDGFRLSLSWPVLAARRVALHLEGGEDSAFGNWAVAGLQWRHPRRPLVLGFGIPVALEDADGPVGVVLQMRLILP